MQVAIVGAGPSGFYAAQAIFRARPEARVDLFDRLPTPYGLVRGGVAPDHQKIKSAAKVYEKIATEAGFRFFGDVELGRDVAIGELLAAYDHVILAVGAQSARRLGIPGEDLAGVHSATEFVAWYNGHPDFQDREFALDAPDVVVVGVGNVAMDVTRILVSDPERLRPTDITSASLERLARSSRARVHVLGRRGPAQAAFTPKELHEIGALDGVDVRAKEDEVALDPHSAAWLKAEPDRSVSDNLDYLASRTGYRLLRKRAEVWMRFLVAPVQLLGDASGRVRAVRVERTAMHASHGSLVARGTGVYEEIPANLVFTAVGYRSVPLPGVPFDDREGRIPNDHGQVLGPDGPIDDLYAVGWAKRGPTGLIGTNRQDAVETVDRLLATGPRREPKPPVPEARVRSWAPGAVPWSGWQSIDRVEVAAGQSSGKIREKLTSFEALRVAARG